MNETLRFALFHKRYLVVFLEFRNLKRRKDVEKHEEEGELLPFISQKHQDIIESFVEGVEGMRPT